METNKTPISLEELLARRRQRNEEDSRPKFLSKQEREKLMAQEAVEVERKQKEELERLKLKREEFLKPTKGSINSGPLLKDHYDSSPMSDFEKSLFKEKFLGISDPSARKKPRRFTEKKFVFDWDESEDTSKQSLAIGTKIKRMDEMDPSNNIQRVKFDDRHWSEKPLNEMVDRDWRIFKEDYNINASGGHIPNPIRFWDESDLSPQLINILKKLGYIEPTPIQRQAIPLSMIGRDFIGVAETGSGKTASFMLPMINKILKLPKMSSDIATDGPYGLVLVPTRELANQIENETRKFIQFLGIRCFAIVGGHSIAEQSFQLRNGAEIIIATPGRLIDCLEQHVIVLNQCKFIVLDEADRMIDLNFEEDLNQILRSLPQNINDSDFSGGYLVHKAMFSATMPPPVERLAKNYLLKPASVSVGQAGVVADTIEQRVMLVREDQKPQQLLSLLGNEDFAYPIIIFVNQKRTVDYLTRKLEVFNYKVISLHGGKGQDQRETAINLIRSGQKDILVATDVAGRGIDIKNVSLVINYDMTKIIEDYIHRVGRTGRAGRTGTAITFLTDEDEGIFYDLRVLLQKSSKSTIPSELLDHETSRQKAL